MGVLGALSILSFFSSKSLRYLIALSMASVVCLGMMFYSYSGLTGHPRYVNQDTKIVYPFDENEVIILNFYLEPEKNIFLVTKGSEKSRYMLYALDWDADLAQELFDAKGEAGKSGGEIRLSMKKNKSEGKTGAGQQGKIDAKSNPSSNKTEDSGEIVDASGGDMGSEMFGDEEFTRTPTEKQKSAFNIEVKKGFILKE